MQITLAHIGAKFQSGDKLEWVTEEYLRRISPFAKAEARAFRSEEALEEWLERQQGRTPVATVLLDSRGRQMSSEAFAAWLGSRRDEGTQHIAFAIGPADGWSDDARRKSGLLLSLGPMTLAHALARAVLAEQVYRAFTILAGHPYHTGH
ncbi:MAG TPA: 23S rRNA (pseudouridine(1915)-N(3))-methyltransferase RlmH [Terracidiphilus sp.]|nr:23S rRNA (pseudouridine(1915)-N(3))-methyltransferase RlmH [Terracidiphilus sp.]